MPRTLAQINRRIRRLRVTLWWVSLRRTARIGCDALRFGTGPAERIAAVMVVGAMAFMIALGVSVARGSPAKVGLPTGLIAFATILATTAPLVLIGWDKELDAAAASGRAELAELRAEWEEEAEAEYGAREREGDVEEAPQEPRSRPPSAPSRDVRCPYCDEAIRGRAVKCRHCGEFLDDDFDPRPVKPVRGWSPVLAMILSIIVPGLGHLYKGQAGRGVAWFAVVFGSFFLCCGLWPITLALFLVCVVDSAMDS